MNGVDQRFVADTLRADRLGVSTRQLVRPQRQLLDEPERGTQAFIDRRGAPVTVDRLPDLPADCVRRDRAVGVRSERTLVEGGDERSEELAFAGRPIRRAAHREVERVGERAPEELGPVVERPQNAAWLAAQALAQLARPRIDDAEPHESVPSPASSRSRPAATAAETVCSKISSSLKPAAFSSSTSRSVTLYACRRTFSR